MPDTLPNIQLPAGVWVNLYAASGIAVGTKIGLQNLQPTEVRLCTKATTPSDASGFVVLIYGRTGATQAGDSGAWAMAPSGSSLNVWGA